MKRLADWGWAGLGCRAIACALCLGTAASAWPTTLYVTAFGRDGLGAADMATTATSAHTAHSLDSVRIAGSAPATIQGHIYQFQVGPDGGLVPRPGPPEPAGADPARLAVRPPRQNRPGLAVAGNVSAHALWQYRAGGAGGLQWLGPASVLAGDLGEPGAVVFDPDGRFVYMTNLARGEILWWPAASMGVVASLPPSRISAGDWPGPAVAARSRGGHHLYVASREDDGVLHAYYLTPSDGEPLELIGSPLRTFAPSPTALLHHAPRDAGPQGSGTRQSGAHLYLANREPPSIVHLRTDADGRLNTGCVEVHPLEADLSPFSLTIDAQGQYVYVGGLPGRIQRFDIAPGDGSLSIDPVVLDFDPAMAFTSILSHRTADGTDLLYLASMTTGEVLAYRVMPSGDLELRDLAELPAGRFPVDMVLVEP